MSGTLSCPNGHTWLAQTPDLTESARICPVCRHPAEEPYDGLDSSQVQCPTTMSIRWLARSAPFTALPQDLTSLLEAQMQPQEFHQGETILRQGEAGDSLMVVCEGRVEISVLDHSGKRKVIGHVGPGELLGEMAILTEEPRMADARALEPVRTLVLSAAKFHETARKHPVVGVVLTNLISKRLGHADGDVLQGKSIAGYLIGHPVGRGGMGVVYEGHETDTGAHVALKMMHHRLVYDVVALAHFQREASIIRSFRHDNIVRMHGSFHAFHTYFIALEFCVGRTLAEVIRTEGSLSITQIREILGQLASALSYAHSKGVIHRDIKPSNIMLGSTGRLKLMDFGLAKPLLETETNLDRLIAGTPGYMAPEQMLGGRITKRADYFSLGCVIFEMLVGEPLLPTGDATDLLRMHARREAPYLDRIPESADTELGRVLRSCLELTPEQRRVDLETMSTWAGPPDDRLRAD